MRGRVWALAVACVVAGVAVTAEAARAPARDSNGRRPHSIEISVIPASGTPNTRFLIEFKARNELHGKVFYDVEANREPAPPMFADCDDQTAVFRHARRG